MQNKGLKYTSIILGYPLASFALLKGLSLLFEWNIPKWGYLLAFLLGCFYAFAYIIIMLQRSANTPVTKTEDSHES